MIGFISPASVSSHSVNLFCLERYKSFGFSWAILCIGSVLATTAMRGRALLQETPHLGQGTIIERLLVVAVERLVVEATFGECPTCQAILHVVGEGPPSYAAY